MIRSLALATTAGAVLLGGAGSALARDEKCLAAMHERVQTCTNTCVDKAKAAVDPSMSELIMGRACAKNCLKIEMFHGQSCS